MQPLKDPERRLDACDQKLLYAAPHRSGAAALKLEDLRNPKRRLPRQHGAASLKGAEIPICETGWLYAVAAVSLKKKGDVIRASLKAAG